MVFISIYHSFFNVFNMRVLREHFADAMDCTPYVDPLNAENIFITWPQILPDPGAQSFTALVSQVLYVDAHTTAMVWQRPLEHVIMGIEFCVTDLKRNPVDHTLLATFINWYDTQKRSIQASITNKTDTSNWVIPNWMIPYMPPTLQLSSRFPVYVTVTYKACWFGIDGVKKFINNDFLPTMDWISQVDKSMAVFHHPSTMYPSTFNHSLYVAAAFIGKAENDPVIIKSTMNTGGMPVLSPTSMDAVVLNSPSDTVLPDGVDLYNFL